MKVKVTSLTRALETVTSEAEELVKTNKTLDDLFRLVPPSAVPPAKRKPLTPSPTQAPDHKRQKATKASLVSDKPDEKGVGAPQKVTGVPSGLAT